METFQNTSNHFKTPCVLVVSQRSRLQAQALLSVAQLHLAVGGSADATATALQGLQLSRGHDEPRGRPVRVQLLLLVELTVEQLEDWGDGVKGSRGWGMLKEPGVSIDYRKIY